MELLLILLSVVVAVASICGSMYGFMRWVRGFLLEEIKADLNEIKNNHLAHIYEKLKKWMR